MINSPDGELLPVPAVLAKPVTERHWNELIFGCKPDERSRLIPADDCHSIIQELENSLIPMGMQDANELTRILIGVYPSGHPSDPDCYLRGIATIFCKYPRDLGVKAVDRIMRHIKFLPSPAEVFEELEDLSTGPRQALKTATAHLAEHEARAERAEREAQEEKAREVEHERRFASDPVYRVGFQWERRVLDSGSRPIPWLSWVEEAVEQFGEERVCEVLERGHRNSVTDLLAHARNELESETSDSPGAA